MVTVDLVLVNLVFNYSDLLAQYLEIMYILCYCYHCLRLFIFINIYALVSHFWPLAFGITGQCLLLVYSLDIFKL